MQPGGPGGVHYRLLQPADHAALKLLHQKLFPLDYDDEFYHRAVHGLDGIVAWAASALLPALTHLAAGTGDLAPQLLQPHQLSSTSWHNNRQNPSGQAAELLAGFITARTFPALYADPRDRQLLGLSHPSLDDEPMLYVLTLGVAEPYQRHGIARELLELVLHYAAQSGCRAVYLHVASFNLPAIAFYHRAGFKELAVLPDFYSIRTGRQPQPYRNNYDACLFGCLIQPTHRSPWTAVNAAVVPITSVMHSLNACMPWGSARRKHAGAGGHGQQPQEGGCLPDPEAQLGQPQQHLHLQHAAGSGAGVGQPSEWRFAQQQPLRANGASNPPPDWLRSLFTRR